MNLPIWAYICIGAYLGICALWLIVTEIRLWNYAKTILHLEAQARIHMEQISITQREVFHLDGTNAETRKPKKGKRKR